MPVFDTNLSDTKLGMRNRNKMKKKLKNLFKIK